MEQTGENKNIERPALYSKKEEAKAADVQQAQLAKEGLWPAEFIHEKIVDKLKREGIIRKEKRFWVADLEKLKNFNWETIYYRAQKEKGGKQIKKLFLKGWVICQLFQEKNLKMP
jgi:hypothetical protein